MKAQDVRHLRICCFCGGFGDGRLMLKLPGRDKPAHDVCAVQRMPQAEPFMDTNTSSSGAGSASTARYSRRFLSAASCSCACTGSRLTTSANFASASRMASVLDAPLALNE
jgi:hypothetical protein